jgi:cytochrome d ubiquinol oxidase subunit II
MANIVIGIPLNEHYDYLGGFSDFLHPYTLWVGLTTILLFAAHGAIYIVLKTEGHLQKQAQSWAKWTTYLFLIAYMIFNLLSINLIPQINYSIQTRPWIIPMVMLNMIGFLLIPYLLNKQKEGTAFIASCLNILLIMAVLACTLYPRLILSYPDIHHTLTIYNAASSEKTLGIMAIIAAIGTPLVLTYTVCIYWIFRGKVKLGTNSY